MNWLTQNDRVYAQTERETSLCRVYREWKALSLRRFLRVAGNAAIFPSQ